MQMLPKEKGSWQPLEEQEHLLKPKEGVDDPFSRVAWASACGLEAKPPVAAKTVSPGKYIMYYWQQTLVQNSHTKRSSSEMSPERTAIVIVLVITKLRYCENGVDAAFMEAKGGR